MYTFYFRPEKKCVSFDKPGLVANRTNNSLIYRFEQSEHLERELEQMGEKIRETIENMNMSQVHIVYYSCGVVISHHMCFNLNYLVATILVFL